MTTSELHQLFKVELDKQNVITSYPNFLPEEIDIFLNKAYLATINRKVTGNNATQIPFQGDSKSISELNPLIKVTALTSPTAVTTVANCYKFSLPNDFLYYITSIASFAPSGTAEVKVVTHQEAKNASYTDVNKPWLPVPVGVLQDKSFQIYFDKLTYTSPSTLNLTYIFRPSVIDFGTTPSANIEVNDSFVYEIISLAVYYALENIQSVRQQSKIQDLTIQ